MDAELYIQDIGPLLKQNGFKKSNFTWRKDYGESIAVFNIQKSQWDRGTFYINFGVYFRAYGDEASPTENKCHVRIRIPVAEASAVVVAAVEWFEARASLQDAAVLAEADSKNGLVVKELRNAAAT
ncbi:DUF4304 domain-containing protein [Shewanella sp. JNE10-2]|uniref:DUF4304 domain-containing protein n=1 Tax=Shewanella TaxID=22 RepID=UPI002004D563|nr:MULTISPECIES: DUF4304 domain-containing protein [unclassified Shewanella]MCK7629189.1 DUF4304 domain-containing protein [Shewanella sp. JNE9-1]MCK7644259.1 DUF4304 domain-containing protein [Shewanella sp. JNE3-1]MCK7652665.1 DUF4304 domain-containing protein [Shewanella sp. JNE4-1]UPO26468.1 DUF4304 domain-containing protein [Shewanella sp. JNE10-2]UPO33665.1 DUF4304 domain-containing protein [Shewanella sp. JNE7]